MHTTRDHLAIYGNIAVNHQLRQNVEPQLWPVCRQDLNPKCANQPSTTLSGIGKGCGVWPTRQRAREAGSVRQRADVAMSGKLSAAKWWLGEADRDEGTAMWKMQESRE